MPLLWSWVGCVAMASAKWGGFSEENLFKKCEGSAFLFIICPTLFYLVLDGNFASVSSQRSLSCHEAVSLSTWEIFVRNLSVVWFENQFVPTLWLATSVYTALYAVYILIPLSVQETKDQYLAHPKGFLLQKSLSW